MTIQLGDTVIYHLTEVDAKNINRRYAHAAHNRDMMRIRKDGYVAHFGNPASTGQPVPLIVAKVWSATCVNGQAVLDGNDSLWVTSTCKGEGPGYWYKRV